MNVDKLFSRDDLKLEILKVRLILEFKSLDKLDFEKNYDVIKSLSVKSRNSIDTFISKNNREFIFKDIKDNETVKIMLINGKYKLSKFIK